MNRYTFGKKAAMVVIHQLCMILMTVGMFATSYFVKNRIITSFQMYSIMSVSGLVGSLVCLAYLTNTTGQSSEDDHNIHYHRIDRMYSDVMLLFFLLFVFIVLRIPFKLRNQDFPLAGLLVTVGTLTYLMDLVFLLFYMSIMRRLKGNILLTGSLCYKVFVFVSEVLLKRGRFPGTRDMRERRMIKEAIEAIAEGTLDTHLNLEDFHGHERELAEAVNHIRDGMSEAISKSIRDERMKADLITNVSHDIKTPLTSIVNYAELLKREELDNPSAVSYIRIIDEKAQRLKQLTEDLVEVSKISSGNVKLEMQKIDFVELLYQSGGEFNERFEDRELTIVTKLPREPVIIHADGRQIYRVVENLYTNAAKYALERSRVHVELNVRDGSAVFTMKNISKNPIQVSGGNFDDLTERFVRGEISRTTEGSGLGLSIAKNLTELMGGIFKVLVEDDMFTAMLIFPLENGQQIYGKDEIDA